MSTTASLTMYRCQRCNHLWSEEEVAPDSDPGFWWCPWCEGPALPRKIHVTMAAAPAADPDSGQLRELTSEQATELSKLLRKSAMNLPETFEGEVCRTGLEMWAERFEPSE